MSQPVAELRSISKSYDESRDGTILRDLDFAISAGQALAIVGPSGSGKSTLLNILGTLDRPSSGSVLIDGVDTSSLSNDELSALRCRTIGFIFQLHHLLPQCTVLENVLVPTLPRRDHPEPEALRAKAAALIERVGLTSHLDKRPGQLSGGERQRVAVVRALINDPKLILADEPTGSLDHENATALATLLLEVSRSHGVALAFVTHDRNLAAQMDAVRELKDGKLT